MNNGIVSRAAIVIIIFTAPRLGAQPPLSTADKRAMAAHMVMSPSRAFNAADSIRAAELASRLKSSIDKYRDMNRAIADGFVQFAPHIKDQRTYHFTNYRLAIGNAFRFDPSKPTSLLYSKDTQGRFVLTGAMYTAPKSYSSEKLNDRVPLSVARWHKHVNWCFPKNRKDIAAWRQARNGRPVFGPLGVATREECESAGGRFEKELFGWMVHANVFLGHDPKVIWGDQDMAGDEMMEHRH